MDMCSICNTVDTLIPSCDLDKPESLEDYTCSHKFCSNCLKKVIQLRLDIGCNIIMCPHSECAGEISYYDVRRIDPSMSITYQELLTTSFSQRATLDMWEGCEIWEGEKPLQCFKCKLYMYRWEGCETIYCICGNVFCSGCLNKWVDCTCTSN